MTCSKLMLNVYVHRNYLTSVQSSVNVVFSQQTERVFSCCCVINVFPIFASLLFLTPSFSPSCDWRYWLQGPLCYTKLLILQMIGFELFAYVYARDAVCRFTNFLQNSQPNLLFSARQQLYSCASIACNSIGDQSFPYQDVNYDCDNLYSMNKLLKKITNSVIWNKRDNSDILFWSIVYVQIH